MKKPAWVDEFVAFAVKGNAMALAVGTIIGAAFSTITKSLTDDVIMPIIAIFMGGIDFSELKIVLPRLFSEPVLDEAAIEALIAKQRAAIEAELREKLRAEMLANMNQTNAATAAETEE